MEEEKDCVLLLFHHILQSLYSNMNLLKWEFIIVEGGREGGEGSVVKNCYGPGPRIGSGVVFWLFFLEI